MIPGVDSAHAIAMMADRLRKQGRFVEAIALCHRQLKLRPTYVGARVVLARACMESGDHSGAEAQFRLVIEMSPENLRARMHLGEICASLGRTDEAITHYEAAVSLAPLDRRLRADLIRLKESAHSSVPASSRDSAKAIAESSPDLPHSASPDAQESLFATETLADLYASQGLDDRAAAIYQRLLEERPFRAEIGAKLAILRDKRQEVASPAPSALADATRSEAVQAGPASELIIEPPPVFGSPETWGTTADTIPANMGTEQMLVNELERWLQGVRRYRDSVTTGQ